MTALSQDDIFLLAVALDCQPTWCDGIVGECWHCTCRDNRHGFDSQCSAITEESLKRAYEVHIHI